jgi:hypothetical protein
MATFWATKDSVQYGDQTKNQRDIITQSIISIAFGLSAFLAFCVSSFWERLIPRLIFYYLDPPTEMDGSLRSPQEADERWFQVTRATWELLWVDTCTLSNIGARGSKFGGA